jgi:hypothetical protein
LSAAVPEKTKRIVAFSALFLVSALVTLIILLSGRSEVAPAQEERSAPISSVEQIIDDFSGSGIQSRQTTGLGIGAEETLTVQDFMLPQNVKEDSPEHHLLRPKLERWREEQVGRYWIPLEDIALDLVRRENDRRIEKLFEEIP